MFSVPTSNIWPAVFVSGPIPQQEAPPIKGRWNSELAYQLIEALDKNQNPEVLENFLIKHPYFYLDSVGRSPWTALAVAIEKKAIPLIQAILSRDPTLARKNYIINVSWTGSVEMTNVFLQYGANINQCVAQSSLREGVTALHCSLEQEHAQLTKFLLLRGGVVYEQAREKQLACPDGSVHSFWQRKIVNQPIFADQMIQEIKREYESSGSRLASSLHSSQGKSFFSGLTQDAATLIARFANGETELRHRFLVKLKLIRD